MSRNAPPMVVNPCYQLLGFVMTGFMGIPCRVCFASLVSMSLMTDVAESFNQAGTAKYRTRYLGFFARGIVARLDIRRYGAWSGALSDPSSTDAMFADAARAPFVSNLLFSRLKSYDDARIVFRYTVVNLRK